MAGKTAAPKPAVYQPGSKASTNTKSLHTETKGELTAAATAAGTKPPKKGSTAYNVAFAANAAEHGVTKKGYVVPTGAGTGDTSVKGGVPQLTTKQVANVVSSLAKELGGTPSVAAVSGALANAYVDTVATTKNGVFDPSVYASYQKAAGGWAAQEAGQGKVLTPEEIAAGGDKLPIDDYVLNNAGSAAVRENESRRSKGLGDMSAEEQTDFINDHATKMFDSMGGRDVFGYKDDTFAKAIENTTYAVQGLMSQMPGYDAGGKFDQAQWSKALSAYETDAQGNLQWTRSAANPNNRYEADTTEAYEAQQKTLKEAAEKQKIIDDEAAKKNEAVTPDTQSYAEALKGWAPKDPGTWGQGEMGGLKVSTEIPAPMMSIIPPSPTGPRVLDIQRPEMVGFAYGGSVGMDQQQMPPMQQQPFQFPTMGGEQQQQPMYQPTPQQQQPFQTPQGQQPAMMGQPSLLGTQAPQGQQPVAPQQPAGWTPYNGRYN